MRLINSDGQIVDAKCEANGSGSASRAEANNYGVPAAFLWANTLLSCLALCMAVVGLIVFGIFYRELERENRVLQVKVDGMHAGLVAANIDTNPHVRGEQK